MPILYLARCSYYALLQAYITPCNMPILYVATCPYYTLQHAILYLVTCPYYTLLQAHIIHLATCPYYTLLRAHIIPCYTPNFAHIIHVPCNMPILYLETCPYHTLQHAHILDSVFLDLDSVIFEVVIQICMSYAIEFVWRFVDCLFQPYVESQHLYIHSNVSIFIYIIEYTIVFK